MKTKQKRKSTNVVKTTKSPEHSMVIELLSKIINNEAQNFSLIEVANFRISKIRIGVVDRCILPEFKTPELLTDYLKIIIEIQEQNVKILEHINKELYETLG